MACLQSDTSKFIKSKFASSVMRWDRMKQPVPEKNVFVTENTKVLNLLIIV